MSSPSSTSPLTAHGEWTIEVYEPSPGGPATLALEIDPQRRHLVLCPMPAGTRSAEVGQLAVYRVFYERAPTAIAAEWLRGTVAALLLERIVEGCSVSRSWSGDRFGHWTPDGWEAAVAIADGVNAALDAAA